MSNEVDNSGESLADRLLKKKQDKQSSAEQSSEGYVADTASSRESVEDPEEFQPEPETTVTRKSAKKPLKKEEKEKFYTYMSADNYEEFEEMFIYVRRAISKKTGKKLKVTNMAELAIILAKKQLFDIDKKSFLELVEQELELE